MNYGILHPHKEVQINVRLMTLFSIMMIHFILTMIFYLIPHFDLHMCISQSKYETEEKKEPKKKSGSTS